MSFTVCDLNVNSLRMTEINISSL